MRIEVLFSHLRLMSKSNSKLEVEDISWGDNYYNESGESINFTILNKNYQVGYSYITEDADDWAQPECHQIFWCYCDDKNIKPEEVFEIVNNWSSIEREEKLNKIL